MAAPFVIVQGVHARTILPVCAGYILYPRTRPRRVARRQRMPCFVAARAQRLVPFENVYTRGTNEPLETCAVYHYALVCAARESDSPLFAHAAHYTAHVP